jgi:hypothetical protein
MMGFVVPEFSLTSKTKSANMKPYVLSAILQLLILLSQGQEKVKVKTDDMKMKHKGSDMTPAAMANGVDTATIERILGMKGKWSNGEYKVTIPQNDLSVEVDGFKIIPAMGLSTWVAFAPAPNGVMLMGDLIVTETDLAPVQQEIIRQGLTTSAIHNHFVRNHPNILFMHLGGMGNTEALTQKAKAVLDKIKQVRNGDPAKGNASTEAVPNTLDTKRLDEILRYKAEFSKGVYKYTIGRPDVKLMEHGVPVSTFLGFNTWAAFQGTPERAAVAGDFTMLENEVGPVLKALIGNGIEVVALHNHMVHEQPRIFFLHYWGVGNAEQLARGLRAALDETGKKGMETEH